MSGVIAIGLVGVGDWGRHILRDLKSLGARVHVVARSEASISRASDGGAASVVGTVAELPSDCSGYVVASDTVSHLDAVEPLLSRGKPIYVEKPLSPDLARIRRLPPEAAKLVFIMHKWRYHPGVVELARIVKAGEFGPVVGLRSFRMGWENHHDDVNAIWVLAPHDFSIALHVFGEVPRVLDVWPDPTVEGDGGVLIRAETSSGIPVAIEVSSGKPNKHRAIVLACRDAVCELDDTHYDRIVIRRRGTLQSGEFEERRVASDMPLKVELTAFLNHIAGGSPPFTALGEEIAVIEAIARVHELLSGSRCASPS